MALSRIWSAFIIVAVIVAGFKAYFGGNSNIFSQMVVGKADDAYDTVRYIMTGSPQKAGIASKDDFVKYLAGYGYVPAPSAAAAQVIITDSDTNDSARVFKSGNPSLKVFT